MIFDKHKNFAYSTVATAPSPASSGTSLVVGSGEGTRFPTPPFNATVWPSGAQPLPSNAEIVRVTAISTDTLTIVRAQEGSAARTVVVGDQIAATITNKTLTDAERDPRTGAFVRDDFMSIAVLASNYLIAEIGWQFANGTFTFPDGVADHPGILRISTGASSGTLVRFRINTTVNGDGSIRSDSTFDIYIVFRLNTNDADTLLRLGLQRGDWGANPPTDGIYLEKLETDTNFFYVTRASSAQTRTDSGVSGTGWHSLRIRRKDGSTIGFTLDGGSEVDHTANIPAVSIMPGAQIRNNAASAKTVDLDYFGISITGLSR